jgi:hypothetical protein
MPTARALVLVSTLATLGCDLALFPEQAHYTGADSARASVDLSALAMSDRDDIESVVVEVSDLVLHRPSDDAWVVLGPEAIQVDLVASPRSPAVDGIPVRHFEYDTIAFGLGPVHIGADGESFDARSIETEVELTGDFRVDGDVIVQLRFDLDASIVGDADSGFAFYPVVEAELLGE